MSLSKIFVNNQNTGFNGIPESYRLLYYDIYSENLYKGPVQDVVGTLVNNVNHVAIIENNAGSLRCVKIPVSASITYYLPKLPDNNYNMLVGNNDGTVIDSDIWFVTHNGFWCGAGITVNGKKCSFMPTANGYLFVNLNLSPNFSLKVADKFYLTTSSTFETPQEFCVIDTLNTAEVKNGLIELGNALTYLDLISLKLDKHETLNVIKYDYQSAKSEGTLSDEYWTVADLLHESGILYKLKFNIPFLSSGTGKFAIYRKTISKEVVTAMTLIREFTAEYVEDEYEIDVSNKNIVLFEYDTVAYNPYSVGINKYKSTGGFRLVVNGVLSEIWYGITLGFNYTLQTIQNVPTLSQVTDLEGNLDYLNSELPNDSYIKWGIGWDVIDTTKPIQVASLGYWCTIKNDLKTQGILQKIKFSSAAVSDYTLNFAIIRKIYQQDGVTFDTISLKSTHTVAVHTGDTVIDVSSMNISMDIKDTVGINYYDMANNLNCYYDYEESGSYSPLPWWVIDLDGTNPHTGYNRNLYISMDYEVMCNILKINVDVEELDERVTALENGGDSYSDLNIVMMGDSITYQGGDACDNGNGWTKYFKDIIKSKTCVSYARSGATWSHTSNTKYNIVENTGSLSDDNVIYNLINRLIDAVNNNQELTPDVILIAAGTNDAWYPGSRPFALNMTAAQVFGLSDGYILNQDVKTLTSIALAIRYDCELIKSNFPNCQIILLSPLQSTKFSIEKCFNVGNIIEDCAAYLAAPCIRQDKETGLYRAQEATSYLFTYDGCHTSPLGAQNNGKVISTRFKALVRNKLI